MQGIGSKLGVPVECRLAPSLTESHSPCLVFLGTSWVLFYSVLHSKKNWLCNKVSQKFLWIVKLGHLDMPCLFIFKKKKNHIHHYFSKKKRGGKGKRKVIKSRFSRVRHSSLKLGAFGYALSPLSRTSKHHSLVFKKK